MISKLVKKAGTALTLAGGLGLASCASSPSMTYQIPSGTTPYLIDGNLVADLNDEAVFSNGRKSNILTSREPLFGLKYDGINLAEVPRNILMNYEVVNVKFDGSGRITSYALQKKQDYDNNGGNEREGSGMGGGNGGGSGAGGGNDGSGGKELVGGGY